MNLNRDLKLLLVEDSEDDAVLLLRELKRGGFAVSHRLVDNADALKSALSEESWDLVISDFNLPQFNAPQALELLRQTGQDIPFIIVSGAVGEETAVDAVKSGAHDYLMKKNLARLSIAVARVLREADERRKRREVEAALRGSEENFRLLVEGVRDYSLVMLDSQGRVLSWNAGAERIQGYTPEEIIGQGFECFYPSDEGERGVPAKILEEAAKTGRIELDGWRVRKDGSRYWGNEVITAMREGGGPLRGFAKITRDITEQKQAQDELARRADALAQSNAELQQFAWIASHDLKEPLRMITSYVQLLERRFAPLFDKEAREFLGYIVEGSTRMYVLINDLLTYSSVGRSDLVLKKTDLNRVVEAAISNLKVEIEGSQAQISAEPLPSLPAVSSQLTQLFQNLIGNAIKFQRGGTIPMIRISAAQSGPAWEISVEDNGIGIAPEFGEKIFVIFQRLHTREEFPGTGVGLAICRKIVERHRGRLWVEKSPSGGSVFRFTLPAG